MTDIDTTGIRAKAEAQRAAWERMVELGGGVGLLGLDDPEKFRDMQAWSALTENDHADVVLALLDRIADLERRAAEAVVLLDDHSCTDWDANAARALTLLCEHPQTFQKMHAVICGVCQIVLEDR